jgi:Mrp family chromosome partitioning ATPase
VPSDSGAMKTMLLDGSMLDGVRARAFAAAAVKGRTATQVTPVHATPGIPTPATPATHVSTTPPTSGPVVQVSSPPMSTAISVRTGRSVPAVSPANVRLARPGVIAATYQVLPARVDASGFDLPRSADPHLPMLMDGNSERTAAFRALRRRLAEQKDPRTILVTSAQGDEGKTTCAANLALALAESGRLSVLLIEANLRRPKVASIFGFRPSHCLREQMLAHREQIDSPWLTTEVRPIGLHVLALAPDSGGDDGLHGPTFSASIARWRGTFDYVVIDGPAILESCDASIIHDAVDAVVMVVRSGMSRNRTVKKALEQISADMVAGMVLMDGSVG